MKIEYRVKTKMTDPKEIGLIKKSIEHWRNIASIVARNHYEIFCDYQIYDTIGSEYYDGRGCALCEAHSQVAESPMCPTCPFMICYEHSCLEAWGRFEHATSHAERLKSARYMVRILRRMLPPEQDPKKLVGRARTGLRKPYERKQGGRNNGI